MGIEKDAELIIAILLMMGLLPFVMAWLERAPDKTEQTRHPHR